MVHVIKCDDGRTRKRVTRSKTGRLPAAKQKKTDFLDYIVGVTEEETDESQLKENHLSIGTKPRPPLPSKSARRAKLPKIKSSAKAAKGKLSKINLSIPKAINSHGFNQRRARKFRTLSKLLNCVLDIIHQTPLSVWSWIWNHALTRIHSSAAITHGSSWC